MKHSNLHSWTQHLVQLKQCDKDCSAHICGPGMCLACHLGIITFSAIMEHPPLGARWLLPL